MSPAPTMTETQPKVGRQGRAEQAAPSPERFFLTANAYFRTAALKAAVELDLFTAIADGADTVDAIATKCQASERGIRILSDYLTILGFLTKEGNRYGLTHDSFMFLNRNSPAYIASAVEFLVRPDAVEAIRELPEIVRRGTRSPAALEPDNPMWVTFARAMAPMMTVQAGLLADLLQVSNAGPQRVLDIAAGHGMYGITVARQNPEAEITAVDWAPVLEVAKENAAKAGVTSRYQAIAGSAMTVELGRNYDLVLLTNFLHHFDEPTIVSFLKRIREVLKEGGQVATLEFVPNEDRISPEIPAAFSMMMLTHTPAGDAYTFSQFQEMFSEAGFRNIQLEQLRPSFSSVITATA